VNGGRERWRRRGPAHPQRPRTVQPQHHRRRRPG
jgi:hypothetical protein